MPWGSTTSLPAMEGYAGRPAPLHAPLLEITSLTLQSYTSAAGALRCLPFFPAGSSCSPLEKYADDWAGHRQEAHLGEARA